MDSVADFALDYAAKLGLDEAEVSLHEGTGVSVNVRMCELETVEKHNDAQIVVNVYKNHHTGSASSADMSEAGVRSLLDAAASIASQTGADECLGLADKELMASELYDLDLHHPWGADITELAQLATRCEDAALSRDKRISNSEGANVSTYSGNALYANSHGFRSISSSSQHSLSCSVIAGKDAGMQRDYWYDSDRNAANLDAPEAIGKTAAERAVQRLDARKIDSTETPILFDPAMAKSLIGHLVGALRGGAIYKRASFMLERLEQQIMPEFVTIAEHPHIPAGAGSALHDNEGVATPAYHALVDQGRLQTYVLGSYTARKLGLSSTANAGGVRNLRVSDTGHNFQELLAQMGQGLLVTELIGSGINMVTGDYSRGAAGFWVENGEISYPVEEITIAGNLLDMYQGIVAVGNDTDRRGNTHSGSILVQNMTLAGS
ncbi:MAG: metalloprotease PmbA [Gammaproteobacteria bacterium]|nr:metalloprotease PmbA [Gammaproteobacteria bacterium]